MLTFIYISFSLLIGIFIGILITTAFTVIKLFEITPTLIFYISSIIIALSTLLLSISSILRSEKKDQLLMTPYLSLSGELKQNGNEKYFTCLLRNNGLGPAKIESVEILIDDLKLEKASSLNLWITLRDFIEKRIGLFFDDTSGALYVDALDLISIIPTNEEILVLKLEIFDETVSIVDILENISGKIRLIIHYQSLYEKQYVIDEIIYDNFRVPK